MTKTTNYLYRVIVQFLVHIILLLLQQSYSVVHGQSTVLRWTSSGGGWRALFANIGMMNAFRQAGIIDVENLSTEITAISSNSGTSWLIAQLAYSQQFFDKAVPNDPSETYQFTIDWMTAFENFVNGTTNYYYNKNKKKSDNNNNTNDKLLQACELIPFDFVDTIADAKAMCKLFLSANFQWGRIIYGMIQAAATYAYNDPGIVDRTMNPENRIPLFQNTDLMFQASLMPTSKVNRNQSSIVQWLLKRLNPLQPSGTQLVTYLGPGHNQSVFTVPIATQYTVTSYNASFRYAVEPHMLPLKVYTAPAPKSFQFIDWDVYYLYRKGIQGDIFTLLPHGRAVRRSVQPYKEPFNDGVGTVIQVISASSASISDYTSAIPSYIAQRYSYKKWFIDNNDTMSDNEKLTEIARLEERIDVTYSADFINDLALCSSWSQQCLKDDTRLIDGAFSDGPSLAMNIALYQAQNPDTYLSTTIKVILTNVNYIGDANPNLLAYFSTYFNQGIAPGDWIWTPGVVFNEPIQRGPVRSMQIFAEYMDDSTLTKPLTPISTTKYPYWNVTTAIYNCTTIHNPAYGVQAGQRVQILLIRLNSQIPTNIIFPSAIKKWKIPMAEQTRYLATEPELVNRLQAFLAL